MPRRLNYTNRQKLMRQDVSIRLRRVHDELAFQADLRLAEYRLDRVVPPPSVFIEAYRSAGALLKRFDFGRYGAVSPPADCSLKEFGVPEGILFRVKVSAMGQDSLGRLVAEADGIRPQMPDEEDGYVEPLIQHVAADDIGDELWRVDFADVMPLLKVNSRVPMGVDQFLRDPQYRAVFAPVVMRQILTRALVIDRDAYDDEDENCWQTRWLAFSSRLPGVPQRPEPDEESGHLKNREEIEGWIDDAVESFAASGELFLTFERAATLEGKS